MAVSIPIQQKNHVAAKLPFLGRTASTLSEQYCQVSGGLNCNSETQRDRGSENGNGSTANSQQGTPNNQVNGDGNGNNKGKRKRRETASGCFAVVVCRLSLLENWVFLAGCWLFIRRRSPSPFAVAVSAARFSGLGRYSRQIQILCPWRLRTGRRPYPCDCVRAG